MPDKALKSQDEADTCALHTDILLQIQPQPDSHLFWLCFLNVNLPPVVSWSGLVRELLLCLLSHSIVLMICLFVATSFSHRPAPHTELILWLFTESSQLQPQLLVVAKRDDEAEIPLVVATESLQWDAFPRPSTEN